MSTLAPSKPALMALLALLLSACGGGGGSPDTAAAATLAEPVAAVAADATVQALLPAAGMTWSTTDTVTLNLALSGPDGGAAAGAAVRVFTLSRTSPHDGAPLLQPVPVALLDTAASDAGGHLALALRLPAQTTELWVVATLGDAMAQAAVAVLAGAPTTTLALTR